MNDHFEGVQVRWNANGYNHQQQDTLQSLKSAMRSIPMQLPDPRATSAWTARRKDVSMLIGGNFANGKGNATLFFAYRNADAVTAGQAQFQRVRVVVDQRPP